MAPSSSLAMQWRHLMSDVIPATHWPGPHHMAQVAEEIADRFDAPKADTELDVIALGQAIAALKRDEALRTKEIRLCCLGATTASDELGGRTLMSDKKLVGRLEAQLRQSRPSSALRRRCAANIMYAFLAPMTPQRELAAAPALLRLVEEDVALGGKGAQRLELCLGLVRHGRTDAFTPWILQGDRSAIRPIRWLQAPRGAWFWEQISEDALVEGAKLPDADYLAAYPSYLSTLGEHDDLVDDALVSILNRVALIADVDERTDLRDATLERWSSPLTVQTAGHWRQGVSEQAFKLARGWLTRRVIAAFFGRLAGSSADRRRTTFWSRYAHVIDGFDVFLSQQTRFHYSREIANLRRTVGESMREVWDEDVNAFAMRIGDYTFVEFSVTGNALYVYETRHLPPSAGRTRTTVSALKDQTLAAERIFHMSKWETRARDRISALTGNWVKLR